MMDERRVPSSFRDPNGFVFTEGGEVFRQVNISYKRQYEKLMFSGLYDDLVSDGLIIPHIESDHEPLKNHGAYKVLKPDIVRFTSYPYEWCFSQLKDAALTTLSIQMKSLEHGMTLKDASAYNIQFNRGKPVLIDTLSFEVLDPTVPWVAYRQFCQHFLAPLALMTYIDPGLNSLLKSHLDGVPLSMASNMLPRRTYLNWGLLVHLHMHSKSQSRLIRHRDKMEDRAISLNSLKGLADNLMSTVKSLVWKPDKTVWSEYYGVESNYDDSSFDAKKKRVGELIEKANPASIWDIGANTGLFSRMASERGVPTLSLDYDRSCVEVNYLRVKKDGDENLLPLHSDITNPAPAIGWMNQERKSLLERGPTDTVLALALIHHLAIANNLPLAMVSSFFSGICKKLIIEFVPKQDSNAQRLLQSREDIFPDYNLEEFEGEFSRYFKIDSKLPIPGSDRVLYLMVKE
ncbi:MAG: SAM-dependent methyltransferase [Candidatus Altiarchaeales archaeon]|nr:SAM-dependent methyltransferase [Candidatus Altiarchaeales archaeon]MBD3417034.1 SAM-dependent methyltransferase [Candidatus Altiarchaeales archaeon]